MATIYPDRFEDGGLSEYTGDTGSYQVTDPGPTFAGDSGVLEYLGSAGTIYSASGLPAYPSRGDAIEWFEYFDGTSVELNFRFAWDQTAGEGYQVRVNPSGGSFEIQTFGQSATASDTSVTYSTATSYRIEVAFDDGTVSSGTIQATLYNADTSTQVSQVSISETTYDSGDIGWDASGTSTAYADTDVTPAAPQNLTSSVANVHDITVDWDAVTYVDEYRVYRAESSGSTTGDYTEITTVAAGTTSYADTGLEDGERYYYRVTADADAEGAVSNETDATTDLRAISFPGPNQQAIESDTEDQLTLNWTKLDNSSDGDIEILRSQDGTTGSVIATISNLSTTSYTDTGLADGREYHYTIRRNTDHVTDVDSSQQAATTVLPATTVTIRGTDGNGILNLDLQNQADVSVSVKVETRIVPGQWSEDANSPTTIAPTTTIQFNTEQYLTPDNIDVRAIASTTDASTTSAIDTLTGGTVAIREGVSILLNRSDDTTRQLPLDRSPASVDIDRETNTIGGWGAELPLSKPTQVRADFLDPTTEVHIWHKDPRTDDVEYLFRGFFEALRKRESGGLTEADGRDVLKRLTEGRTVKTYSATPTHEAIEDYITTETAFDAAVTAPTPTTLETDTQVLFVDSTNQWLGAVTLADSDPATIQSGQLQLEQTCWNLNLSDGTTSGTGLISDSKYAESQAEQFIQSGDSWSDTVTVGYDIPAENARLAVRHESTNAPEITVRLDGTDITTLNTGLTSGLSWKFDTEDFPAFDPGEIAAGDHTIEFEVTSEDENITIDQVALYDDRWDLNFDNSTDANGHLAGPELYPANPAGGVDIEMDVVNTAGNITAADIDTTWTDTTEAQGIAVSNDGGSTFPLSVANRQPLDQDFPSGSFGTRLVIRLTLSGHGTRTNATPTEDFMGQAVSKVTARVDTNDLAIEDETELRRNHFRNLLTLAERAGYALVPRYDPNALTLAAYPEGTSGVATWRRLDARREDDVRDVYDAVHVEGRQADDGSYPEATIPESPPTDAAVFDDKDPTLTSDKACESKARRELTARQNAGQTTGEVTIVPEQVLPGKSYPVEGWDPDNPPEQTLQRQRFQYGISEDGTPTLTGRLEFSGSRIVRDALVEGRRETDRTKDAL